MYLTSPIGASAQPFIDISISVKSESDNPCVLRHISWPLCNGSRCVLLCSPSSTFYLAFADIQTGPYVGFPDGDGSVDYCCPTDAPTSTCTVCMVKQTVTSDCRPPTLNHLASMLCCAAGDTGCHAGPAGPAGRWQDSNCVLVAGTYAGIHYLSRLR
jgi:hypothetical protein